MNIGWKRFWPFNKEISTNGNVPLSKTVLNKIKDESEILDDTIKSIDIEVTNKKLEISNMILQSLISDIDSYKETFVEVCNDQEDFSKARNRELKSYWTINIHESSLNSKIKLEKKGDDGIGISILFNYESGYSDKKWSLGNIEFSEMKEYRNFRYRLYGSEVKIYENILYQYYKQFFLLSKNKELSDVKFNYDKITNLIGKKSRRDAKLNSIIND